MSLSTWTTLRDQVESYMVSYIGAVRLQNVTIETLDSLYDELEESAVAVVRDSHDVAPSAGLSC